MKKSTVLFAIVALVMLVSACGTKATEAPQTSAPVEQATITQEMLNSAAEEPVGPKDAFKGKNITLGFSQRRVAGSEWYEQLIRVAKAEAEHLGVELVILDAQGQNAKQVL